MAYEIFQYQNKHGYYQVPRLDQQDMETLINSFPQTRRYNKKRGSRKHSRALIC